VLARGRRNGKVRGGRGYGGNTGARVQDHDLAPFSVFACHRPELRNVFKIKVAEQISAIKLLAVEVSILAGAEALARRRGAVAIILGAVRLGL